MKNLDIVATLEAAGINDYAIDWEEKKVYVVGLEKLGQYLGRDYTFAHEAVLCGWHIKEARPKEKRRGIRGEDLQWEQAKAIGK